MSEERAGSPLVVVVVVGYSCADPVLTELEFQVEPTNIRHTHIPPPSPFSSASFATAVTLLNLNFLLLSPKNPETTCIRRKAVG
jgi:hypothetical protein